VACILAIVALVLAHHGLHLDTAQFRLRGASVSGMRLGMVLALFSFVGFESATALGEEARNPLKTIPRAVLQSAIGLGFLFVVCAYTEVLGFRGLQENLGQSPAPFHTLAHQVGVSALGIAVDVGAMMKHVRLRSRLYHRRRTRAAHHVPQWTHPRPPDAHPPS
jgi:amino acid transporter